MTNTAVLTALALALVFVVGFVVGEMAGSERGRLMAYKERRSAAEPIVRALIEALTWAAGAEDFQEPHGRAYVGWNRIAAPAVKRARAWLNEEEVSK